jgi:hypothetical protein
VLAFDHFPYYSDDFNLQVCFFNQRIGPAVVERVAVPISKLLDFLIGLT